MHFVHLFMQADLKWNQSRIDMWGVCYWHKWLQKMMKTFSLERKADVSKQLTSREDV